MSEQETKTLDFYKLEDRFFCIDVLTRARFSIKSSETELAADIDRIITALTSMPENPSQQVNARPRIEVEPEISNDDDALIDLLPPNPPRKEEVKPRVEVVDESDDDGIVDLLTGTKIR